MNIKRAQSKIRGQSLPEYALIVVLVALVAIIALGLIGLANARGFAIVDGALGAKNPGQTDTTSGPYLYFEPTQLPQCGQFNGTLGLFATIWTNIPLDQISVSTDDTPFIT